MRACGGDEALRRDVESLLAQERSAEGFLSGPALAVAAKVMRDAPRASMIGTQLGGYQILSLLGTGGMGEVYRARDTTLGRDVAIKVLPAFFANDPDRLARLAREARLLAALNHPHIATIHGLEEADGVRALVMELVEGPTLAERLAHGPRRNREDGLAAGRSAAHRRADRRGPRSGPREGHHPPRREAGQHQAQSRRQRQGARLRPGEGMFERRHGERPVASANHHGHGTSSWRDCRHARLHEPGAGSRSGHRQAHRHLGLRVRAVRDAHRPCRVPGRDGLGHDCGDSRARAGVGRVAGDTCRRGFGSWCGGVSTKIRNRRLHDIADARIEIDDARSAPRAEGRVTPDSARSRERIVWLAALGFLALIAAIWAVWASRPPAPAAEMRVDIATPPTTDPVSLAISPDGQKIVFVATSEGRSRLWLRSLSAASARPLEGTDAASLPFWSPDSRSVGFFADGKLKRIDIDGGSATVLANAPLGQGGAWNRDGAMLFAATPASPILHIPASGGEPAAVTTVEAPQQVGHSSPQFLPDGHHFLYYVTGTPDARGVYISQLGGSEDETLARCGFGGRVRAVRALAVRSSRDAVCAGLRSGPAGAERQSVCGGRTGGGSGLSSAAALSASGAGPVVYRTGSAGGQHQFAWFDRAGKQIGAVGDPDSAIRPGVSLSPDGRRVAVFRQVNGNIDVWLLETGRGVLNRFTADLADDIFPIWSPDGTRIVFSSTPDGART